MLVPSILYKQEIILEFQKRFYTTEMMYETGCLEQWYPNIPDMPKAGQYSFAIIDNNKKLIGYLAYWVDFYSLKAYNFGLISFDKGNPIIGKDLFTKLQELLQTMHKIEWKVISGNPVEKHYDKFCKKYNGTKHIFKDSFKDANGIYHDDIIYEILTNNK